MDETLSSGKWLVSIRDSKTEVFGPVVTVTTEAEAVRMFEDLCSDKTSPVGRHPEDYDLYLLGGFDALTGEVFPKHHVAALGSSFRKLED